MNIGIYDHPSDVQLIKKLNNVCGAQELLIFLRDEEFYPQYYDAPPGRKEFIEAIISVIDEII